MKDLLKFGRYVGRITEAHRLGDTEGERRFADQGEEVLESLIPLIAPATGDTVQETPFAEQFLSEMRSTLDGEAKAETYLQRLIKDAKDIKRKAEAYLQDVEGQRAAGRYYMQSCIEWADSTLEELAQLSERLTADHGQPTPQPERGPGVTPIGNEAITVVQLNTADTIQSVESQKGHLFTVRKTPPFTKFATVFGQLIAEGVFSGRNTPQNQAMLRAFLIGPDTTQEGQRHIDAILQGRLAVAERAKFGYFMNCLFMAIDEAGKNLESEGTKKSRNKITANWVKHAETQIPTFKNVKNWRKSGNNLGVNQTIENCVSAIKELII